MAIQGFTEMLTATLGDTLTEKQKTWLINIQTNGQHLLSVWETAVREPGCVKWPWSPALGWG